VAVFDTSTNSLLRVVRGLAATEIVQLACPLPPAAVGAFADIARADAARAAPPLPASEDGSRIHLPSRQLFASLCCRLRILHVSCPAPLSSSSPPPPPIEESPATASSRVEAAAACAHLALSRLPPPRLLIAERAGHVRLWALTGRGGLRGSWGTLLGRPDEVTLGNTAGDDFEALGAAWIEQGAAAACFAGAMERVCNVCRDPLPSSSSSPISPCQCACVLRTRLFVYAPLSWLVGCRCSWAHQPARCTVLLWRHYPVARLPRS